MTRPTRASLVATLFLPIIVVVAACGGASATPTPTPPPGGVTVTPDPNAGGPTGAFPSFDLSTLGGAIPGLDSYQVTAIENGKTQYSSVVVTKPELAKSITTYDDDGTTVSSRFVVIGKDVWTADGPDGAFTAVPEAMGSLMLLAFDPLTLLGAFAHLDLTSGATDQGEESKNGIASHHLKLNGAILGSAIPAGGSVDLWVADAGYPVAFEVTGGTDGAFQVELSNVNDPANKVDKPS